MSENQEKSNIVPSIIAGVIGGIIKIVAAMAFSALIFTGTLAAYLPQGRHSIIRIFTICCHFNFHSQLSSEY